MATILIVDDEAGVRASLSGVLRDEGYTVDTVDSGEACLEQVTRASYDLLMLDIWLPGMDGLDTLARLRERHIDAQVIMISGHGSIENAVRATKADTRRSECAAPAHAGSREARAARARGPPVPDHRRQPLDPAAA